MAFQDQPDALTRGIQAGILRAQTYRLEVEGSPELIRSAFETTRDLVARNETEISDRFIELFGELVTVAVIARFTYGDDALTERDLDAYLRHSLYFHNSFQHG
jgi:hypothetical protein